MTYSTEIAIVGGGIAGLTTAVALNRAGFTAQVYEAAPMFHPTGTSISLWPNAMACLTDIGIDIAVRDSGHPIDGLAWRRPDGRPYFSRSLADLYEAAGQTGLCVRRADLFNHLLMSLDPGSIHLDHRLAAVENHADGATITFENGAHVTARHVIGADGIWSKTREAVLADGPPRYAGYGAWLGLSPVAAPKSQGNEGCEYIGKRNRFGVFETGDDTRYWFLVENAAAPTKHATKATPRNALAQMGDWSEDYRSIVAGAHPGSVSYVSFYDRPIARSWGKGHVTLIGDAMHPFVPNLGQGACQAIEDAVVLTAGLKQDLTGDALNGWMKRNRDARVRYMRKTANKVGRLLQSRSPIMRGSLPLFGRSPMEQLMRSDLQKQFMRVQPA